MASGVSGAPKRPWIAVLLGAGMMVIILVAALAPNGTSLAASTPCQYSSCQNNSNSAGTPLWVYGSIVGAIVAAAAIGLAALLIMRRRRPPQSPGDEDAEAADAAGSTPPGVMGGGSSGGAATAGSSAGSGASAAGASRGGASGVGTAAVLAAGAAGAAVGAAASRNRAAPAAVPVAGAAAGAAAEGADPPNIDELMDELDRISNEILKKDKAAKTAEPDDPTEQ
jgi:hypothetical protein